MLFLEKACQSTVKRSHQKKDSRNLTRRPSLLHPKAKEGRGVEIPLAMRDAQVPTSREHRLSSRTSTTNSYTFKSAWIATNMTATITSVTSADRQIRNLNRLESAENSPSSETNPSLRVLWTAVKSCKPPLSATRCRTSLAAHLW